MKTKQVQSSLLLVLTALIWGAAFVAQSVGMDYVGPLTFNAIRFLVGAIALVPCLFLFKEEMNKEKLKTAVIGGICCGLAITVGSILQQLGIMSTTVGKAGFITSLYIVIVPLLGRLTGKKVSLTVWISVVIAVFGMYLLCMAGGFSVSKGDLYIFLSAIAFSFHIIIIDHFSPKTSGVWLSCIQFLLAGLISGMLMFSLESPTVSSIMDARVSILYAGIMSSGVAYTLQIVAQKHINPVVASLILSLESVFSLLAGWLILGQVLSPKELLGCAFVFGAIILAQIPQENKKPTSDHRRDESR